ncbi:MAG TPA: cyanophycin synthetase [Gaiellaceae bacterium]|nr:cyanophycin synthetase [Gaiellaceae bacterium]
MPELDGRSLWLAGIGGAGLSGYAVVAKAWGAEVAGWDQKETPYLAYVRAAGIPVVVAPDPPRPPAGAEVVVSSAYRERVAGRSRAELLAELVSLRRSIVVAGAHGKTTTAAMVAFCLDAMGDDPSFLIGGEVPQLGGNARAGSGWLVVEGDESDGTVFELPADVAVITNVELDHHAAFGSTADLEERFERWAARVGKERVVWGKDLTPAELALSVPGEHNRLNAACALAALELAGFDRAAAAEALSAFRGVGRRLEDHGQAGGVRLVDDYAHHPAEVAATLAAARTLAGDGRVVALFQPHLYSRTLHAGHELGRALAAADAAVVTDVYGAREEPVPGVSGKLVADALADARPGMPVGWAPALVDAAQVAASLARPGDLLLTVGAGDVDAALPLLREELTA